MRSYSSWFVLLCLSVAACSDDDAGSSEEAVTSADASAEDSKESDNDKKSGSAGKSGSEAKAAGGSKAASDSGDKKAESSSDDDKKSDDAKKDDTEGEKKNDEAGEGDSESTPSDEGEGPKDSETKGDDGTTTSSNLPTNGDQLSLCTRAEGDCNKGLACQSPATSTLSPGRGYCSKICETDADCSGLAPEGSKYTCSTGNGTNTCELACSGSDDTSCPSGLSCTQTGRRRVPAAESGDAGVSTPAVEGVFHCRYPFEVSKTWGACGDSTHVCDENSRCSGFWFGVGHCTHSCEADADCEKPESGDTKPTCVTLVPAFGDNAPVKQCALNCAEAKDACPYGLACIEARQAPAGDGMEPAPAAAWCQ